MLCAEREGEQERRRLCAQRLPQAPLRPPGLLTGPPLPSMSPHELELAVSKAHVLCAQAASQHVSTISGWKVLPAPPSPPAFRLEGPSPSPLRHLHPLCSVLPPLGPVTTAPHHSSRTPRWVLSAGEQGAGAPRPPEPRRACSAPCGYGFNHRRDIHPVCRAGSASSLLSTSRDLEPQEAQVPASFPNTQDSHSLATPH